MRLKCCMALVLFLAVLGYVALIYEIERVNSKRIIFMNQNISWQLGVMTNNTTSSESLSFKLINSKGIFSFNNVCIKQLKRPITRDYSNKSFIETMTIVIYNSSELLGKNRRVYGRVLTVAGTERTKWNHWSVYFMNSSIPTNHTLLPSTAFFFAEANSTNLYHYWKEEFLGLFSVIRDTNRLHPGAQNQILFRHPGERKRQVKDERVCKDCRSSTFDIFTDTLYTTKKYYLFYDVPANTCYSSAVFGTRNTLSRRRDGVEHVLQGLNMTYKEQTGNKTIVFIDRKYRRLLNIEDLAREAEEMGFKNVSVVDLELLTVQEQLSLIIDTDILVGVQGAGLQWAIFMRPGSVLVEVTWPVKEWRSVYSFVGEYNITWHELQTNDTYVNWASYEKIKRGGKVCSPAERVKIQAIPPTAHGMNLWKYADVRVDPSEFRDTLLKFT